MMSNLKIQKKNEVFLTIESEPHVYYELQDQFTFDVPGAKFMPRDLEDGAVAVAEGL